ncbi:MAG: alpha/beta hydrolase [Planctomycetes bacterium]|nr:alpha/beta hydrolase [Planctomycetota bacterium]
MSACKPEQVHLYTAIEKWNENLVAQKPPPTYTLSYEDAFNSLVKAQSGNVKKPDADIKDTVLNVGPSGKVNVRIVRPKGARGNLPCLFYVHGAGWVMGNAETHDRLVRILATEIGVAVVFPVYTNSPKAQFPVPLEECYAVLEYVSKNNAECGIDTKDGLVIAGDSVGGNMATVLAMMAKERSGPKIIFQLLFYPVTDANFETESYNAFADGPWLTKKAMKYFWDAYLPDVAKRKDRHASPLQASLQELAGMPPAFIITDENDVLRDEGEAYARKLDKAGVKVAAVRLLGVPHDWAMLNDLADTCPVKAGMCMAVAETKKWFQTIFPEHK